MIQETMGEDHKVIGLLGKILKNWDFFVIDAIGSSWEIITRSKKSIPLLNNSSLASSIWT